MKKAFLLLLAFSLAFVKAKSQQNTIDSTIRNIIAKNQVLLTNLAIFKDHKDEMAGASAFLINYRSKTYAVTAKHLLGEAMGVEPEIKATELNKKLINWKMFPRVQTSKKFDTVETGTGQLDYSLLDKDILLLEVLTENFNALPLIPNFILPQKGDKLYIIGCPYSQENCKQNIYEVVYKDYDESSSMLTYTTKSNVELAGFSGAPIVDINGKVVSILTTGWDEGKTRIVAGTFIKEIEKIK